VHKNKDTFISDILSLLNNKEKCTVRGELGKQFIQENFSSDFVYEILEEQLQASH
jgi:hypothetical protein